MRTNVVLDDELLDEAFRFSRSVSTKQEMVEVALREYVNNRKRRDIRELRGKVKLAKDYDYKAMRSMLHDDAGFLNIARINPNLKLY